MRVRIWASTFKGQLRSKIFLLFQSPFLILYSTSKLLGFDLDLWRSSGSQKNNHSKGNIWLPIWLLLTPSLYLVPFSRYSTSKFSGFYLDLWPLKVIRGQKVLYHLKGQIWLPIWLLWTPSHYLLLFSRYSTSKFLGFDLDLWPQKVIWGQQILYHSKSHIWLPIWLLWAPSLYLLPFARYSTSKFLGFDLDLWPSKVIWGQKKLYHSKGHIWLSIWLLWTPSLYLLPLSRYSTFKFLGFDLDLWPLKVIRGQKILYHSKGHIWLSIWLLWTPSLYLLPISRYSTSKFFRVWPWPLTPEGHLGSKNFIPFERPYMTSYLTSMDTISLSLTALEIFDFQVFRVRPWPLTPKSHPRSKNFIPFERPYMTFYLTSMDAISLSLTVFEIFDFKVF